MDQRIMQQSELGSSQEWREFCESFGDAKGENFETFRSNPVMLEVVEGTDLRSSFQNIEFFRKNRDHVVSRLLNKISSSDLVGCPQNTFTFLHNNEWMTLNPTTLRYAKNWANIIDLFLINNDFDDLYISEIGAGYGGEAKVFFDLYSSGAITQKLAGYSVYDLASSIEMIKRFLSIFGYKVNFKEAAKKQKRPNCKHLVVSNGALSEMRGDLLETYFSDVVLKADYGYFIVNFDTRSQPYEGGISNDEFFTRLLEAGKNPIWLDEVKFLTRFDKGASKLIAFGIKKTNYVEDATKRRNISNTHVLLALMVRAFSEKNLGIQIIISKLVRRLVRIFRFG